jgi:hypothetical protein
MFNYLRNERGDAGFGIAIFLLMVMLAFSKGAIDEGRGTVIINDSEKPAIVEPAGEDYSG